MAFRAPLPFARCLAPRPPLLPKRPVLPSRPFFSSPTPSPPQPRPSIYRKPGLWIGLAAPLAAAPLFLDDDDDDDDDANSPAKHPPTLTTLSNQDLVRAYAVYTACSFPSLVDAAPALIHWAWTTSLPAVRFVAEHIVRATFFAQFVGAETLTQSAPVIDRLAKRGVGALFTYSVEAESEDQGDDHDDVVVVGATAAPVSGLHQDLIAETRRSVEFAAETNRTWGTGTAVALKLSGMFRQPQLLERLSDAVSPREAFNEGSPALLLKPRVYQDALEQLTPSDAAAAREMAQVLHTLGAIAAAGNVKLIIDAEQSWLQPGIDVLWLEVARSDPGRAVSASPSSSSSPLHWLTRLARRTGPAPTTPAPTFYMTLQTSLRRSPALLRALLDDAKDKQYPLGVKLVRGAYVEVEHRAAAERQLPSPAWSTKDQTDKCYNACASVLVDAVAATVVQGNVSAPSAAAFFATHNRASVQALTELFLQRGLASPLKARDDAAALTSTSSSSSSASQTLTLHPLAAPRICFGQLLGMADDITDTLGRHLVSPSRAHPSVYKYVPYGPLDKVLPYLVRRAKENKAIMSAGAGGGGALEEKRRLKAEMKRRVKAWWEGDEGAHNDHE